MERAEAQEVTLSEGIRLLLALWTGGYIDVHEVQGLGSLPSQADLRAMGERLDDLAREIENAREVLSTFGAAYGRALDMSELVRTRRLLWDW